MGRRVPSAGQPRSFGRRSQDTPPRRGAHGHLRRLHGARTRQLPGGRRMRFTKGPVYVLALGPGTDRLAARRSTRDLAWQGRQDVRKNGATSLIHINALRATSMPMSALVPFCRQRLAASPRDRTDMEPRVKRAAIRHRGSCIGLAMQKLLLGTR